MGPHADDALVAGIVEQVRRHLPDTVERSATRTWAEVEAYGSSRDRRLPADLRTHTRAVFDAVLRAITENRRVTRDDFSISVAQARRRVRQGVTLADFMQGFRIGQ